MKKNFSIAKFALCLRVSCACRVLSLFCFAIISVTILSGCTRGLYLERKEALIDAAWGNSSDLPHNDLGLADLTFIKDKNVIAGSDSGASDAANWGGSDFRTEDVGLIILDGEIKDSPMSADLPSIKDSLVSDMHVPTVSWASIPAYANLANYTSVPVSGSCSEDGRNIVFSGGASGVTTCSGTSWSATLNLSSAAEGSNTITATHSDSQGHNATASASIIKDTTPPVFNSLTLINQAADNIINIADISLNNYLVSAVTATGFSTALYQIASTTANCAGLTYSSSARPTANALSGLNGSYKVCVRLADAAGNYTYGASASFDVDSTAPTVNVGADQTKSDIFTINATVSGATSLKWTVQSGQAADITFSAPSNASTTVQAAVAGTYTLRLTVTDDGGNSAYDDMILTWQISAEESVIFITSTSYTGNLGGLSGADALCTARAAAAGLTGSYLALLSTSTVNAKDRTTIPSIVRNTAGTKVADNGTDLWDGSLDAGVTLSEFGTTPSEDRTWTGSNGYGVYGGAACNNWTDATSNYQGAQGEGATTGTSWFNYTQYYCGYPYPLYCLSQGTSAGFVGATGSSGGTINLKFNLPSSVSGWNSIEVRRATGTTAPACSGGIIVHTWSGPFTANGILAKVDSGTANTTYSYRACIKDATIASIICTGNNNRNG